MSGAKPEATTVAYLTKRFPRLSETFILDEILGLEAAGVPLRLYAGADPQEPVIQPDVARVSSPVTYLRERGAVKRLRTLLQTIVAHARLVTEDPARYARALGHLLRDPERRAAIRHFGTAGRLVMLLRRDRARHVHAAFAHTPAGIALYVHLLSGLPFSFAGHAKDLYLSDPVSLAARAATAEFVLVCSASAGRELARTAGPAARIVLAYHGVDGERFKPGSAVVEVGEPVNVLAVGRLVEKKGYPIVLAALAAVAASGRRVRCEIVGSGAEETALREQIDTLELREIVTLRGALAHQQIADAYRETDMFVQASVVVANGDRDGIPNSLLEAMASGLPVVASDVAGIPEVVTHAVTGLLVPPADSAALAAALSRLVDDVELRRRLGSAARAHVVAQLDRRVCSRKVASLLRFGEGSSAGEGPVSSELRPVWSVVG